MARDEVPVLLGDGAGGLHAGPARALGSAGSGLALLAANIDGLGAGDLLVVDASGRLTRFLDVADGGLSEPAPASLPVLPPISGPDVPQKHLAPGSSDDWVWVAHGTGGIALTPYFWHRTSGSR